MATIQLHVALYRCMQSLCSARIFVVNSVNSANLHPHPKASTTERGHHQAKRGDSRDDCDLPLSRVGHRQRSGERDLRVPRRVAPPHGGGNKRNINLIFKAAIYAGEIIGRCRETSCLVSHANDRWPGVGGPGGRLAGSAGPASDTNPVTTLAAFSSR